jgi:hypothetical protein
MNATRARKWTARPRRARGWHVDHVERSAPADEADLRLRFDQESRLDLAGS